MILDRRFECQKCSYNIPLVCSSDGGWAGCTTSQACAGMVTLKMRRNTNPLPTDYTQVPIQSKFMVVCGMACVGGWGGFLQFPSSKFNYWELECSCQPWTRSMLWPNSITNPQTWTLSRCNFISASLVKVSFVTRKST